MTRCKPLTKQDEEIVEAFQNFLSWGVGPALGGQWPGVKPVPPAWWAYAANVTKWCPPVGEL